VDDEGLRLRGDWPHTSTVYVLGAGFTKAFFKDAPLLRDWQLRPSLVELKSLPAVRRILDTWDTSQRNVEQIMSRVEDLMPYDTEADRVQFALLLGELKRDFEEQIEAARVGRKDLLSLYRFAGHCVFDGVDCITFNADTFLDEALWWANPTIGVPDEPYWHPDGGYGFFCRPASSVVSNEGVFMDITAMRLLKMHGSFNWFPLKGSSRPFGPDALVHFETWLPTGEERNAATKGVALRDDAIRGEIVRALEAEPFFVPPVLGKSTALAHPVVAMIWTRAFEILANAREVVFVGYSFPPTDLASRHLFAEALALLDRDRISVIANSKSDEVRKSELIADYREVLGPIPTKNFRFIGAVNWARERPQTRRPRLADGYAAMNATKRFSDIKWWLRLTSRQERGGGATKTTPSER
jgi:hypothetical protein